MPAQLQYARKSSVDYRVAHLQLAIHKGSCQVAKLHPAAHRWQGNLLRQAAGAVLHQGQRGADAGRPLKRLHSRSSSLRLPRFGRGISHRRLLMPYCPKGCIVLT